MGSALASHRPARLAGVQLGDGVERRVPLGNIDVRVISAGAGSPAVLFDSPLGTPLEAWSLVAPSIADQTQVILWDRPGIGGSGPFQPLDAAGMADAMAAVVARVGASSVVAVGHSRGGIDVLALAAFRPELVAGLVLVEPSHPEQLTRMPDADGRLLGAVRILAKGPGPVAQLPALAIRTIVRIAGQRARPGARLLAELAPTIARRADGFMAEHDAGPALLADVGAALTERGLPDVPLVVLTGDENYSDPADQAVWATMHAELVDLSDRGRHVHVACGHEMPFSHPGAVIDAIRDVLAESAGPAA